MTDQYNINKNLQALETVGKATLAQSGIWRLCFLVLMSLALSNLSLNFLALLFVAPVPLAIASLIYGRKITLVVSSFFLAVLLVTGTTIAPSMIYIAMMFLVTLAFSTAIVMAMEKHTKPYLAICAFGALLSSLVWSAYGYVVHILKIDIKQLLLTKFQEAQEALNITQELKLVELVDQLHQSVPVVFTFVPFVGIWIFFVLIVKNKKAWRPYQEYPFEMKDLMGFRTPFECVYLLVFGLGMGLISDFLKWDELWSLSLVAINLAGAFYFFQGFGIFWESLNRFQIKGLFRNLLIVMVLFWAIIWVALIGLFDTWFDFRKLLENRNEGDLK